jgi:peptidyl-prolyl cis-trans isomerase C
MFRAAVAMVRQLTSSRLVQFVILGGALFAASPGRIGTRDPDQRIEFSSQHMEALARREADRHGESDIDPKLRDRVTGQAVQDEILVREARRLGLDQDDAILRRRLIQKALFLAEDLGGASRPLRESDLTTYFAAHRDHYTVATQIRFRHVFARDERSAAALLPEVSALAPDRGSDVPAIGEPLPIGRSVNASATVIDYDFGATFSDTLVALPAGKWQGPVKSKLGYHLVIVDDVVPAHPAEYDEVRDQLRLDATIARRQQAVSSFFAQAHRRYRITIDGTPMQLSDGAPRTAAHYASSVED